MDSVYGIEREAMTNQHHKKRVETIRKEVERTRQYSEQHEKYGHILYEKVNTGRNYIDYYNTSWKAKNGKTLNEYKYGAWQNIKPPLEDEAEGINDMTSFGHTQTHDILTTLPTNETNMEDETKVETATEEATPEPEVEVAVEEQQA